MSTLERLRQRVADPVTCREVGRLLQSYLDGELDDAGKQGGRPPAALPALRSEWRRLRANPAG